MEVREAQRSGDAVRHGLGEEAFTAAWEAGAALSWEQAAALAMDER